MWLEDLFNYLKSIVEGIGHLVDSVLNFISWIPSIISASDTLVTEFMPSVLAAPIIVVIAIYIIRIVVGGDNG